MGTAQCHLVHLWPSSNERCYVLKWLLDHPCLQARFPPLQTQEKGQWRRGWSWAISFFKILPRYFMWPILESVIFSFAFRENKKFLCSLGDPSEISASCLACLCPRACSRSLRPDPFRGGDWRGLHVKKGRVNGGRLNKSFDVVKQLWSKGNMPIQRGYLENCQYRHSGSLCIGRQVVCGVDIV